MNMLKRVAIIKLLATARKFRSSFFGRSVGCLIWCAVRDHAFDGFMATGGFMATSGSHGACIEGAVSFEMPRKMYRIQYQWRSQARRIEGSATIPNHVDGSRNH